MGAGNEHPRVAGEVLSGGPGIVEFLAEEWRQLCDASDHPLPFNRPEWVGAYFRSNDKARRFFLLTVRIDGKLKAVLPLIDRKRWISRMPANVLRGPSDFDLWPSDILVADESVRPTAARELWRLVRGLKGWDVIELPNIPQGGAAEEFLRAATEDGFPSHRWEYMQSPCIRLEDRAGMQDTSDIALSASLRRNIRGALRKVEKEGGIQVRSSDRFDSFLLQRLYELEASGWKGEQGNAILLREKDRRFHDDIAIAAQNSGYLSLHALEMKGQVVAVSMGFNYKKIFFGMKMGWDQGLKSFSLGHLLINAILKDCLRNSVTEFHMMGLKSDWKTQWTKNTLPYSTCYVFHKGIYGKVVKSAIRKSISYQVQTISSHEGHIQDIP